jgi:hypothetical protein
MPASRKAGMGEVKSLGGTSEKIGWLLVLAFDCKNHLRAM